MIRFAATHRCRVIVWDAIKDIYYRTDNVCTIQVMRQTYSILFVSESTAPIVCYALMATMWTKMVFVRHFLLTVCSMTLMALVSNVYLAMSW